MKLLKQEKRWCVRTPNKVPFVGYSNPGHQNNPAEWKTYDEMKALAERCGNKFAGLGIFLSEREFDDGLVLGAIDIDAHHNKNGEPNPLAEELLSLFSGTYIEYSPSGNGYHILFNMDKNRIPRDDNGALAYKQKDDATELEIYIGTATNRYMTFTGNRVSEKDEITDQTEEVLQFIDKFMKKPLRIRVIGQSRVRQEDVHYREPLNSTEIKDRLKIAKEGKRGQLFKSLYDDGKLPPGMGHKKEDGQKDATDSVARWTLLHILAYWLGPDPVSIDKAFRSSALMSSKWDSKRRDTTYGAYMIQSVLEDAHIYCPFPGKYGDGVCRVISDKPNMPIKDLINLIAKDEDHKGQVSVAPMLCGMGKSTAISQIIRQVLENQEQTGNGLLVITDRTHRLWEYMQPRDPELRKYLEDNAENVTILDSDSIADGALSRKDYTPVLLMTTQRFFSLSHDDVLKYLNWNLGTRPLVLIDERPEIRRNIGIDSNVIGEMRSSLRNVFQGQASLVEGSFTPLLRDCETVIQSMQNDYTEQFAYRFLWKPDYSRFQPVYQGMGINAVDELNRHRMELGGGQSSQQSDNAYQSIHALLGMREEPGLVQSTRRDGTGDQKQYNVVIGTMADNSHCIQDIPAKVIILDGTAEISPEYLLDNYDFRWDCETKRPLTHLKLRIIKLNTTKSKLRGDKEYRVMVGRAVRQYVDALEIRNDPSWAMFTYQDYLAEMNKTIKAPFTDYFGDIVGKNDFNEAKHIVQIGLNRYPDWVYFRYLLEYHEEFKQTLSPVPLYHHEYETFQHSQETKPEECMIKEQAQKINEFKQRNASELNDIMCRSLFAECEQMIFRGIIRNADCAEDYTYHMFIDAESYPGLISQMIDRYLPLGAKIEIIDTPPLAILYGHMTRQGRNGKQTQIQSLVNWHDSLDNGESYSDKNMQTAARVASNSTWRKFKSFHKSWLSDLCNSEWDEAAGAFIKKANWYISDPQVIERKRIFAASSSPRLPF